MRLVTWYVLHQYLGCASTFGNLQVVQVLPTDYYAQLEVAHHISCYAFSNKVR